MQAYAEESGCLRAFILRYFGETPPAHCDYCSNCLEQALYVDVTAEAREILACVAESGGRYGLSMIARILHGDRDERIAAAGLDGLPAFGALRRLPLLGIRNRIRTLVGQGYLEEAGEYRILRPTERAEDLRTGKETVFMRTDKKTAGIPAASPPASDAGLFERLRALRMEIAKEERKAPFMVFSDATLRDMCRRLPRNEEEFLQVSGVGRVKARQYGPRFLALLRK